MYSLRTIRRAMLHAGAVCAVSACLISLTSAVYAASMTQEQMESEIERLQRSVNMLEKQVYRGNTNTTSSTIMDENEGNVVLRLSALESKLQEMTGKIEQMEYEQRRLGNLMGQTQIQSHTPAAISPDATSVPSATGTGVDDLNAGASVAPDGTRPLGTLPATAVPAAPAASASTADIEKTQYDKAFALLRNAKYKEAIFALNAFIDSYPDSTLTQNAYYWLGEAFYVQKDYENASVAFLQGYQKEPKGGKAADNLLKLALSLGSLNKNSEACATYKKLFKEFSSSAPSIRRRAEKESATLGCKN